MSDQAARDAALIAEYDAEKPARTLSGWPRRVVWALGVGLSLYAIYWVLAWFGTITANIYIPAFAAVALAMTFLVYRGWARHREAVEEDRPDNPHPVDWILAVLAAVPMVYAIVFYEEFSRRAVVPTDLDVAMGLLAIILILEATRRTVGWIMVIVVALFIAYAYFGPILPDVIAHRGYALPRFIGHEYLTSAGIFSTPLQVAATYIILFTIYGAVLEYSGASRFFLDVSFAAFGQSSAGPGRTVALAGFLLGTVSGSGVATTVTLGSVSWPLLKRAGYPQAQGGGVLAAAGIGAILSPPTLGAAAFIIAEFLRESYLVVLLLATVPTLLYYLGIILAVELDARRYRTHAVAVEAPPLGRQLLRYGYHFSSLFAIVIFMVLGMTPFRAVVLSTGLAFALSFLDRSHWLTPRRLWDSLAAGAIGVLPVVAVCAASGIIVGVVTLTGLGLKLAGIIVALAAGNLALTALFSGMAVMLLGLAVPVTASFIIAAVIIKPAFDAFDVPSYASLMFIFYYAVLSEVSPPTALSAYAAAAITGGSPTRTMMMAWRYTLPAFLVPFVFVLAPAGEALLLRGPILTMLWVIPVAVIAVGALAVATGGWLLGPAKWPERTLMAGGALALLYTDPLFVAGGLAAIVAGLAVHVLQRRGARDAPVPI
ncbi:MAG: TRAP transporter fused permease subunit [Chloroflexota bacterium]|nr:TRAP transporter fused permease subunit [Chloroflexota bacterium]